jgi:hypothetical protein
MQCEAVGQCRLAYLIKVVTCVFVLAADGGCGEVPRGARYLRQPWGGGAAGSVARQQRCPVGYLVSLWQQRRDYVAAGNGAQQQRRDDVAALHDQLKPTRGHTEMVR